VKAAARRLFVFILSEAKYLFSLQAKQQVLRFAQDDNCGNPVTPDRVEDRLK
jgi:hypothetical protein